MAIAFRAPEISSPVNHHQGSNQIQNPIQQSHFSHHGNAYVAVQGPPTSPGVGGLGGSIVILSPLSAVIQHQTAWLPTVAPQMMPPMTRIQPSGTQQHQQMFSGFPPISQNNQTTSGGAPMVGVPLCHHRDTSSLQPFYHSRRCVTMGSCLPCHGMRRGKLRRRCV